MTLTTFTNRFVFVICGKDLTLGVEEIDVDRWAYTMRTANDYIAAIIIADQRSNDEIIIDHIFVKPKYRQKGLATHLLKLVLTYYTKGDDVVLCCRPIRDKRVKTVHLIDWLSKLGFQIEPRKGISEYPFMRFSTKPACINEKPRL